MDRSDDRRARPAAQHARAGRPTLLDPYGTVSEAEFFAVVTECFFDQPIEMRQQHPELYELLMGFYRQDTAGRLERRGSRRRGS